MKSNKKITNTGFPWGRSSLFRTKAVKQASAMVKILYFLESPSKLNNLKLFNHIEILSTSFFLDAGRFLFSNEIKFWYRGILNANVTMKKIVYKLSAFVTIVDKYLFCIHIVTWKKRLQIILLTKNEVYFSWEFQNNLIKHEWLMAIYFYYIVYFAELPFYTTIKISRQNKTDTD